MRAWSAPRRSRLPDEQTGYATDMTAPSEPQPAQTPNPGTPSETPERLTPAETPERLTPAEAPERLSPE